VAKTQIPEETWAAIDAERVQGATVPELSAKYGVSENSIKSRFRRQRVQGAEGASKTRKNEAALKTPRQQRYANVLPFCKTKQEAKEKAGYSPRSRTVIETPAVQAAAQANFAKAAAEEGLTLNLIAKTLKDVMTSDSARGQEKTQASKTAGEMLGVLLKAKEETDSGAVPIGELAQ
jgi:hypothetical protein